MADTENRNIDFKDASKESVKADKSHNEKKPHKKKSFAWWAGVIVLILISITFILPATGISSRQRYVQPVFIPLHAVRRTHGFSFTAPAGLLQHRCL